MPAWERACLGRRFWSGLAMQLRPSGHPFGGRVKILSRSCPPRAERLQRKKKHDPGRSSPCTASRGVRREEPSGADLCDKRRSWRIWQSHPPAGLGTPYVTALAATHIVFLDPHVAGSGPTLPRTHGQHGQTPRSPLAAQSGKNNCTPCRHQPRRVCFFDLHVPSGAFCEPVLTVSVART